MMLSNVLGALAAAFAFDLDMERAVATLARADPGQGRLSIHDVPGDHTVVLDTVKAPLWSTRLLVADLRNIGTGPLVFALGDMSDTGANSGHRYRELLRNAAEVCDLVIGIGRARQPAARLGQSHGNIVPADNLPAVARLMSKRSPAVIVVKGNKLDKSHATFLAAFDGPKS